LQKRPIFIDKLRKDKEEVKSRIKSKPVSEIFVFVSIVLNEEIKKIVGMRMILEW